MSPLALGGHMMAKAFVGEGVTWVVWEVKSLAYRGEQVEEVDHPCIDVDQRLFPGPSTHRLASLSWLHTLSRIRGWEAYLTVSLISHSGSFPSLFLHLAITLFAFTFLLFPAQFKVGTVTVPLTVGTAFGTSFASVSLSIAIIAFVMPISWVRSMRLS